MSKEGSLDAPIRHPIDFEHPDFLNPEKLDAEMRRAFDISVMVVEDVLTYVIHFPNYLIRLMNLKMRMLKV